MGSKFLTSAAIWGSNLEASKPAILSTPHLPASRLSQKAEISLPRGETTPSPVTTTLRSEELADITKNQTGQLRSRTAGKEAAPEMYDTKLLLLKIFDVFDDIADALELFGLFVGDFIAELLFQ